MSGKRDALVANAWPKFFHRSCFKYIFYCVPFVCRFFYSFVSIFFFSLFVVHLRLLRTFGHSANLSSQVLLVATGIIAHTNTKLVFKDSYLSHHLQISFHLFHNGCCFFFGLIHSRFVPFQNPDIVLVHYLNVPYPDDNKMAVITPSLALWGDKKEWTKEELVCQLKPMFFSEDEPDATNEIEITVS